MKSLFVAAVCVFFMLTAGVALAHSETVVSASIWNNWIFGFKIIWQPFLFAFVIVGFGTFAIHQLYQRSE